MKVKGTVKAVDTAPDVDLCHEDTSTPFMLAGGAQIYLEDWMHPVEEWWITTLWFPFCYPKMVKLIGKDHVTLFMDATLIPRDHYSYVFV